MATITSAAQTLDPSKIAYAKWLAASLALKDKDKLQETPKLSLSPLIQNFVFDQPPAEPQQQIIDPKDLSVGIIGAGISGLYTALILEWLNKKFETKIKYEILEANPHRIGGRLYTHYFGDRKDGTYQYYDVGAMRFPDTPIMARTFDLFKRLGMKDHLGDYIMQSEKQPTRYNDITRILPAQKKWHGDPFSVSSKNGGPVPDQTVKNPDEILDDAYFPYRRKIKRALEALAEHEKAPRSQGHEVWEQELKALLDDLETAWKYLMQHDKFSLRDYLSFVEGHDDESIHWLETLNAGTGWFDQAFSENVLESLAFDYGNKSDDRPNPVSIAPEENVKWKYIPNGSYKLAENTANQIDRSKIEMDKLVTGMKLVNIDGIPDEQLIEVKVRNESKWRTYDTVFCSTTFAAMQKMDLTGLNLPYTAKAAIRSLRYDPSTKVAIQFKQAWWIRSDGNQGLTGIKGGLGKTDMPIRTCVYPSYNLDNTEGPAVLLCSYTWGQDSERIASMIDPVPTGTEPKQPNTDSTAADDKVKKEAHLKETMIDNLARLHSVDEDDYQRMQKLISDSYITHHSYDWSKDPYTCGGAFALFSPSQFRQIYPRIIRPMAGARLHVIGEAASVHHAWVVGALDSAARGIYMMLTRFGRHDMRDAMEKEFGVVQEVDRNTAEIQVGLGMLKREDQPKTPSSSLF